MNKLRHIFKLGWAYKIKRAARLSYPPYQFTIEPTNICNLKCNFCPQSDPEHRNLRPAGQLTEENLKLFLERRKKIRPGNNNINFTLDGEPLINKGFPRFLELAAGDDLFSIFASNGILLTPDVADRFAKTAPFSVSIDFASDKSIFESIRGKRGNFDLIYENLLHLIKRADTSRNVHLNINDITSFSGVDAADSLIKMKGLFPKNTSGRVRFFSRQFHNFCGHLDFELQKKQYRLCPYPWVQMAVAYNGDCVPCCRDTSARSVLGNVFRDEIMNIWDGREYRQFRHNLLNGQPELNAACKNCDLPYSGAEPRWRLEYLYRSLVRR